ncbi:MAG: serine/threonine-protein kinase [Oscillatoriaceae bacterium SKW80]|nr:serine/threonine-protein kinase [Oscillatoriaceae bacterium SKYG93]MCX8121612.1 serine/threonine-protein kinase [Oscillatoriaceae bacterium SKW80]MDW8453920.1 serine/threonine-protein kinase [Oscillatoriaceae cyanobacterium SKYGB_i_bin93]HIK28837.1 serine/threonine-protein kinase [Oscillatoriaceae cyanobacterium M7585_C2015_266]
MVKKRIGGRYQLVKKLGQGGFGKTFLARDLHLPGQPPCVVKQLSPKNTDSANLQAAQSLFEREAEVLYRLGKYERIPQLFAHFQEETEFYLVQEFIEGKDLSKELTPGKKVSEEEAIALLENILEVLEIVHENNVIHRDIKPSNLIRRSKDNKIVLIDFGAVKQINTQVIDSQGQTSVTIAIGSPGYMPNEQMVGKPRFSSDIYAVGMVIIQALTGLHPRELSEDIKTGEIIWRDKANVSPKLADVIDKMVRWDFRQRYPSAKEALAAVKNLSVIVSFADVKKTSQNEFHEHSNLGEKTTVLSETVTENFCPDMSIFKKISILQGDITKQQVDAIVNTSDKMLSGTAGVDREIQNAGGLELRKACIRLGGCNIGEAKITKGYNLPAKWVIHTAIPLWFGENSEQDKNLAQCYRSCLNVAAQHPIRTIVFPAIDIEIRGLPIEKSAIIALLEVKDFLEKNNSLIERVIFITVDLKIYNKYCEAREKIQNLCEIEKLGKQNNATENVRRTGKG